MPLSPRRCPHTYKGLELYRSGLHEQGPYHLHLHANAVHSVLTGGVEVEVRAEGRASERERRAGGEGRLGRGEKGAVSTRESAGKGERKQDGRGMWAGGWREG